MTFPSVRASAGGGKGSKRRTSLLLLSALGLAGMALLVADLGDSSFGRLHLRRALSASAAASASAFAKYVAAEIKGTGSDNGYGCKRLGLPRPIDEIPLPPSAYEMDRGQANNFVMGILDGKEVHTGEGQLPLFIHMALPRAGGFSDRIDKTTGKFRGIGNSGNTWDRASASKVEDGIFIDVGGYIGDSSLPSAALGIDTYVFEPVRANTNLIHSSVLANQCRISEHLTVINALVGDKDSATESVYVTEKADNAAATKALATKNVGSSAADHEQAVHMIKLDSFFPAGIKVQNLKIDVQGFELHVLRGAERILKENKGRLHVRVEYDLELLKMAGTNPPDLLKFMEDLGYKMTGPLGYDIDFE